MKILFIFLVLAPVGQTALLRSRTRRKSTSTLNDLEKAQTDASALLSALLKDLQSEQKATDEFSGVFEKWCQDAQGHKESMMEIVQRKIDETNISMRSISAETTRLDSELTLVQAAKEEKMQQLQEVNDTESFVAQEYSKQLKDMDKLIENARRAVKLVSTVVTNKQDSTQSSGASLKTQYTVTNDGLIVANAVSDLLQKDSDALTDSEKTVMSSYVNDPNSADSTGPQELARALNGMLNRLESDRSDAVQVHGNTDRSAFTFEGHLNTSIFEIDSQVSSIQVEIAQRRREQIRLEGQISDLTRLVSAIQKSKKSTHQNCYTYTREQTELVKLIRAEIDEVKTVLEQTAPDSADMFLATSFLQVQQRTKVASPDLSLAGYFSNMAQKYPNEATWYLSEASKDLKVLSETQSAYSIQKMLRSKHQAHADTSSSSDALKDIQEFVDTEGSQEDNGDAVALSGEVRPLLSDPAEVQKIKSSYRSLLAKVQGKQQSVQDGEKWCEDVLRQAKLDSTKRAQTVKRMDEWLNLQKAAVIQYDKESAYYESQGKLLESQKEKLRQLSADVEQRHSKSYEAMSDFSRHLISLATEMSDVITAEEKRAADMTKSLVEKLQNHQNLVEVNDKIWRKSKDALLQTDTDVQGALEKSIKYNDRRIVQFQLQSKILTTRFHARKHDVVVSQDFVNLAHQVCSKKSTLSMKNQEKSLERQAGELQKTFNETVAPFA